MPNRLARETSAYLLQHRENPVDWYPWGEPAWERARSENKPVLVSIGYSSCHWCHVMERESFESDEIAALMNERLVCIKVDREERPDVDQIYMDAVVRLTGQGGWPLNMFCTPDGRPFYGGTYFPPVRAHGRPSWPEVVAAISQAYAEKPDEVDEQAGRVMEALTARPEIRGGAVGREQLRSGVHALMERADRDHGGFGAAPKFPTPTNLELLLYASTQGVAIGDSAEHLQMTLKRMARGGIYDQLGGGFHRYSTDGRWLVPHFEKMLYDQGQLLRVYAEAYRQSGEGELAWPIEETVAFLEREMRSAQGGYFASQDADSEGEEGKFYVWDRAEVEAVLGSEEGPAFCDAYAVVAGGTFERTGKSVLEHALAGERPRYAAQRQKLLEARAARIAPATDTKQITAWIAYTIGGVATAAAALDREDWLAAACRAADFVLEQMRDADGRLMRIHDGEGASVPAFLDDHGALLCALLDLGRAGGDESYLAAALDVADTIRTAFYDAEKKDFFLAADLDTNLPFRPSSDADGATPAANGLAALGLARMAELSGRADLREVAESVVATYSAFAERAPVAVPTLLRAAALLESGLGVGLILGDPQNEATRALAHAARQLLSAEDLVVVVRPDAPPAWLDPAWLEGRALVDGAPTAYVCRGRACSLPANKADELALPPAA